MNFLLIQALATSARYYGDSFTVECPTGSGRFLPRRAVADELAACLTRVFLRDERNGGRRSVFGDDERFQNDDRASAVQERLRTNDDDRASAVQEGKVA